MEFQKHYEQVLAELAGLCAESGRPLGDVTVVAVSKTVGVDAIGCALEAGLSVR